MTLRIGIDMDNTIADWIKSAIQKTKEMYGVTLNPEDIHNPQYANYLVDAFVQKYGYPPKEKGWEIYERLCSGTFYLDLEPLEGAIEAVREVAARGHRIVFLTKPTNWNISSEQKAQWIDRYFSDMKYDLVMVSSMHAKHGMNLHIIVDDDPRALENHPTAIPICIAKPWNKSFRDSGTTPMVVIEHLSELPRQVEFINGLFSDEENPI